MYCGVFFLASSERTSAHFREGRDCKCLEVIVDELTAITKWLLFLIILTFNGYFLVLWAWRLMAEMRGSFRDKCRRCFVLCCLCGSSRLLVQEVKDAKEEKKNLCIIQ